MAGDLGKGRRILVAGGGIGGLAAAAAFAKLGFKVQVLEQAEDFREVGAGIQIGPNGSRALQQLGLLKEFDRWAWRPSALVMHDALKGTDIAKFSLCDELIRRFCHPYPLLHRSDIFGMLLA